MSPAPVRILSKVPEPVEVQLPTSYSTAPDGRVRNPIPSKLKGMADNRNGNFGVMHMDLTKPETQARDAAAKRTSESTAAAAKRASMNGYQSVKRSQLAWRPYDALSPQTPPHFQAQGASVTAQEPFSHSRLSPGSGSPSAPPSTQPGGQSSGQIRPTSTATAETALIPVHVTKAEQARLLTLLRSLHPILVVDQLCKALAYFGGIPGAPPPADGKFPESAAVNGPGSLFVGWLGEIFPPVDGSASHGLFTTPSQALSDSTQTADKVAIPAATTAATTFTSSNPDAPPVKRPRGRPKGSKSSKVRKDKGIKKKLVAKNGDGPLPAGEAGANTNVGSSSQQPSAPATAGVDSTPHMPSHSGSLPLSAIQSQQSPRNVGGISTPGSKKRGRPKGSKNRPKAAATETPTGTDVVASQPTLSNSSHIESSPLAQKSGHAHQTIQDGSQGNSQGRFAAATPAMLAPTPRTDHGLQANSNLSPASIALLNAMGASQQAGTMVPSVAGTSQQVTGVESPGEIAARKRKVGDQVSRVQPLTVASHEMASAVGISGKPASPTQASQSKRRRLSKEANQPRVSVNADTSVHGTQPASPSRPNSASHGGIQSTPGTVSSDSQNPIDKLPGVRTTARFGPNQRLHRQQQQQKAQALSQQNSESNHSMPDPTQQRSPSLSRASHVSQSPQQQAGGDVPTNTQARQQASFFPVAQPQRSPQTFYTQQQRQSVNQYGQLGNAGGNYGLGLPNSHSPNRFPPGMVKHNSGDSGMAEQSQQGLAAINRNKQTADGLQQAGFTNHQSPRSSSGPSPGMSQFSPYNDGSYLNMGYVLNGQNAANTANAAAAAFGGGSPLDGDPY
jgi:hypothetical protein